MDSPKSSAPDSIEATEADTRQVLLSAGRAFLVQFTRDADARAGYLCGRIEHFLSGDTGRFKDGEELLKFMVDTLSGACAAAEGGDDQLTESIKTRSGTK